MSIKKLSIAVLALSALAASVYVSSAVSRENNTVIEPESVAVEESIVSAAPVLEKKTEHTIVIKDHKFSPETVYVPVGEKVKLIIDNQDPTPEEFESHDMSREKIIGGNKTATIMISPLKAGKYHFFGEFNMDSANGYVIAE